MYRFLVHNSKDEFLTKKYNTQIKVHSKHLSDIFGSEMYGKRLILCYTYMEGREIVITDQQEPTERLELNRIDTGNYFLEMNTRGKPGETRGRFPLLAARSGLEELCAQ